MLRGAVGAVAGRDARSVLLLLLSADAAVPVAVVVVVGAVLLIVAVGVAAAAVAAVPISVVAVLNVLLRLADAPAAVAVHAGGFVGLVAAVAVRVRASPVAVRSRAADGAIPPLPVRVALVSAAPLSLVPLRRLAASGRRVSASLPRPGGPAAVFPSAPPSRVGMGGVCLVCCFLLYYAFDQFPAGFGPRVRCAGRRRDVFALGHRKRV